MKYLDNLIEKDTHFVYFGSRLRLKNNIFNRGDPETKVKNAYLLQSACDVTGVISIRKSARCFSFYTQSQWEYHYGENIVFGNLQFVDVFTFFDLIWVGELLWEDAVMKFLT